MSLLVQYTLKTKDDHGAQQAAMIELVEGLRNAGIADLHYSCFSTDDPVRFIGVLEFRDEVAKQGFLNSDAFAAYREKVGPTFAKPPDTTAIWPIASTRM